MKRPFAVFGLTLFCVMTVGSRLSSGPALLAIFAASVVLFLLSLCFERSRRSALLPTVFLSAAVGCLLLFSVSYFVLRPARAAQGENVPVVAVAESYPETGSNPNRRYVTAKLMTADETWLRGRVRISLPVKESAFCDCTADVAPGDLIGFVGTVYEISADDLDVRRSFFGRNVFLGAFPTQPVQRIDGGAPARFFFARARHWMLRRLKLNLPPDAAGLAASVLLGDKSLLPDGVYNDFKAAGIAHIMAVSGLHLSIWTFLVMALLSRKGKNQRAAAAVSMVFVLAVMALAMFSGSVLRAGLMLLVYLGGFLLRRTPESLNSLGFAVTVILFVSPTLCLNVGFILSVLSTLAILVFALPLTRPAALRLEQSRAPRAVKFSLTAMLTTAAISVCVAAVTLPVQVDSFETVSLVSVLSNLLILPALMPLLVCSGGFAATMSVPGLSRVMRGLLRLLTRYCFWVARSCGNLPHAVQVVPRRYTFAALLLSAAVCGLLALLVWAVRKKERDALLRIPKK